MRQPSWIGHKLGGRYQIEKLLGQGGMSAVYKATDPNLKRVVAVKIIHSHLSQDPEFLRRFEAEATAVAQLRHPNIVQVFDFNHEEETYYMVLEFIPGETLQARLKRLNEVGRQLSLDKIVQISRDVCDAVEYAHRRGLIHRDIKPANVMLNTYEQSILMDFGIVKMVGEKHHTATGAVVGTARYMSPEQIRGDRLDHHSDIYSLGVLLFEMVSGKAPYEADSAMTIMMMHLNDPIPNILDLNPKTPNKLRRIIEKALAKDPAHRFHSAGEMEKKLKDLLDSKPSDQPPPPAKTSSPEMPSSSELSTKTEVMPFWRDERVLNYAVQIISAVLVIGFVAFMILNFANAAEQRGLRLGYGFIEESAGFPIGESVIDYEPSMSFGRAFLVGLANTLKVSLLGILAATILGTLVGLARLSPNWLLSQIALAYIEFHRNIPLLVLLFLWFFAVFQKLPPVEESIKWPGPVYLNQRGVYLTWFNLSPGGWIFVISILLGFLLAVLAWIILERTQETSGFTTSPWIVSLGILVLIPVAGWFLSGGSPGEITLPEIEGFNFRGGLRLTPEFTALFVGLVMYTAAFIAEVVRAGIQSVDRGQIEAALSLGLKTTQVLRLILIPQALRVITPPLISQYLNLTKNSSLAIAIGYPDLFSVGRIMINQAGRAVSVFSMVMGTYLVISLITSLFLNIYNRRIQLVER